MAWASWSEFWNMGGYGLYVWGSYGVTTVLVVLEILLLKRSTAQTHRRLKRMKQWENQ